MADQLKSARVTGSTLGSELPARISELETAISVITGIPLDVLIATPMSDVVTAGLRQLILQDLATDPAGIGRLARNGDVLKFNDGFNAMTFVEALAKDATETTIADALGEKPIFTDGIRAGTLGTNNVIMGHCDLLVNTILDNTTCVIRLKLGGVTFLSPLLINLSGSTQNAFPIHIEFNIRARNSVTLQSVFAQAFLQQVNPAGLYFNAPTLIYHGARASLTLNSAISQTLQLTVEWSSNSPPSSIQGDGLYLRVLK